MTEEGAYPRDPPRSPDFLWCVLDVCGPDADLDGFLSAARGPGLIDWRPHWYEVFEDVYYRILPRCPSRELAEQLAQRLSHQLRREYEDAFRRTENPNTRTVQPLDLNALIPIPEKVLREGFIPGGQAWMTKNWGTAWPIRQVRLEMRSARTREGIDRLAHFEFLAEDWAPMIAIQNMKERWPSLRFAVVFGGRKATNGRHRRTERDLRIAAA